MHVVAFSSMRHSHRRDAVVSALIPFVAALVANGLVFASGLEGGDPAFESLSLAPPSWLVAAVWLVIFPMWGLARWRLARHGDRGRRNSWWVVMLMVWALAYPVLTGFELVSSAWANLASLILAAFTGWRASTVDDKAAWLIVPSIVWIAFATVLGFMALAKVA